MVRRGIVSIVLALSMIMTAVNSNSFGTTAYASETDLEPNITVMEEFKFHDVPEDAWYKGQVYTLYYMGVIDPDSNGNFNANQKASYYSYISWLLRAGQYKIDNFEAEYITKEDKANVKALLALIDNWILSSNWKTGISRIDALRLLKVYLDKVGIQLKDINSGFKVTDFMNDLDSLDKKDFDMVVYLFNSGIIEGASGKLNPGSDITRAEAITLIYRAIEESARIKVKEEKEKEAVDVVKASGNDGKDSDGDGVSQEQDSVSVKTAKTEEASANDKTPDFSKLLGEYSTVATNNADRNFNIDLAAKSIDGAVVNPDETFSFYKVSGKHGKAEGYKPAGVISGGKMVTGYGGGVCQDVTTLYNAVLLANLEIVARTNHSLKSSYIDPGRDATFSSGSIDFKFKNTYDKPIKISAKFNSKNRTITIGVYGASSIDNPKVKLYTKGSGHTWTLYREVDGKVNYMAKSVYNN